MVPAMYLKDALKARGAPTVYDQYGPYYRPHGESIPTSNRMREPELAKLIAEIKRGGPTSVVVSGRELSNSQFIRIITASDQKNSRVFEIDASENDIDDDAIRDAVPFLSANNKITVLNLAYNRITAGAIPYFLKILESNYTLTCINLFKNQIDDVNLSKLQLLMDRNAKIQQRKAAKRNKDTSGEAHIDVRTVDFGILPSSPPDPSASRSESSGSTSSLDDRMQNVHDQYSTLSRDVVLADPGKTEKELKFSEDDILAQKPFVSPTGGQKPPSHKCVIL